MAVNKNGIVVLGAVFVDIKGFPEDIYVPDGRNAGHVEYIHGGVSRNVVEDIANLELRPTFLGIADEKWYEGIPWSGVFSAAGNPVRKRPLR